MIAVMPGIERPIPTFHAACTFIIQYPIQISNPIYLEAVGLEEVFTIQWTVGDIPFSTTPS